MVASSQLPAAVWEGWNRAFLCCHFPLGKVDALTFSRLTGFAQFASCSASRVRDSTVFLNMAYPQRYLRLIGLALLLTVLGFRGKFFFNFSHSQTNLKSQFKLQRLCSCKFKWLFFVMINYTFIHSIYYNFRNQLICSHARSWRLQMS